MCLLFAVSISRLKAAPQSSLSERFCQFLALRSLEYTPLPSSGTASMKVSSRRRLSIASVGCVTGSPWSTRFMVRQSLKEV